MTWERAQVQETLFWGNCYDKNAFNEIVKQPTYIRLMGLAPDWDEDIQLYGKTILDIGGGPWSILLRCVGLGIPCMVVDPCNFPSSVRRRYRVYGIQFSQIKAEDLPINLFFDEIWIYNCLQHVENPDTIIKYALSHSKTLRIAEWLNTEINDMHPHTFTYEWFVERFKGYKSEGGIYLASENECFGKMLGAIVNVPHN